MVQKEDQTSQVIRIDESQSELTVYFKAIILMGPPGCGKGTQCKRISEALQLPVVSTGDILRANIREGTQLGIRSQKAVENGELVPDEWIFKMLVYRLSEPDCKKGFILDGVPRTALQAKFLTDSLRRRDGSEIPFRVIRLEMDDKESVRRIAGRRVCTQCGATFNLETNPPALESRCDFDGGKLIKRPDDCHETFGRRLIEYRQRVKPIYAHLTAHYGMHYEVNCDASIEEISRRLLEIIN